MVSKRDWEKLLDDADEQEEGYYDEDSFVVDAGQLMRTLVVLVLLLALGYLVFSLWQGVIRDIRDTYQKIGYSTEEAETGAGEDASTVFGEDFGKGIIALTDWYNRQTTVKQQEFLTELDTLKPLVLNGWVDDVLDTNCIVIRAHKDRARLDYVVLVYTDGEDVSYLKRNQAVEVEGQLTDSYKILLGAWALVDSTVIRVDTTVK